MSNSTNTNANNNEAVLEAAKAMEAHIYQRVIPLAVIASVASSFALLWAWLV